MRRVCEALSWKRLSLLLITILAIQVSLVSFLRPSTANRFLPKIIFNSTIHSQHASSPKTTIVTGVQGEALTAKNCQGQFPDLYYEVNRAVEFWRRKDHDISSADTNISWRRDGAFRILIHENELRILETKGIHENKGYRMRTLSVLSQIDRALRSASAGGELLPTVEAAVVIDDESLLDGDPDTDTRSIWTFATNLYDKNHERHWLIPDFGFYSARSTGSFADMRRRAEQHDAQITDKIQKVVWRGVKWTNELIRGALLSLAEGKEWADVAVVDWKTRDNIMAMDDSCRYAFTVHTEGRTYSGRLAFLLNCNSLPLIHPLTWTTHFYHLLVQDGKDQNFVPVQRDFSDLEDIVNHYQHHPQEAQRIIQNSLNTFRSKYTTPAATSCYLRQLIAAYGGVSVTPEVTQPSKDGSTTKRRGVSFEEYIHLDDDFSEHDEIGTDRT